MAICDVPVLSKQAPRDLFESSDDVGNVLFARTRRNHKHGGSARQIVAVRESFSFIGVFLGKGIFRESPGPPAGGNAALVDETEVVEEPVQTPLLHCETRVGGSFSPNTLRFDRFGEK